MEEYQSINKKADGSWSFLVFQVLFFVLFYFHRHPFALSVYITAENVQVSDSSRIALYSLSFARLCLTSKCALLAG